jgi:hypothetical protein
MLRYLKAVQMMKQIIEENNLTVMATVARYACAYEAIAKPEWWDKSKRSVLLTYMITFCSLIAFLAPVQSSNKALISAIFRATLGAKSIFQPSALIRSNGMKMPDTYPR